LGEGKGRRRPRNLSRRHQQLFGTEGVKRLGKTHPKVKNKKQVTPDTKGGKLSETMGRGESNYGVRESFLFKRRLGEKGYRGAHNKDQRSILTK